MTALSPDPAEILGDIDAWDLRQEGDWWRFTARLGPEPGPEPGPELGPRGYLRAVAGGAILADAPGPLHALLRLGGARGAGFAAGPSAFPHHVLAPGDHIGAVGLEGTGAAVASATLQPIPHRSRDALIAEHLLRWRHAARRGLPLFLVRAETDAAADVTALGQGAAYANVLVALDSLLAAAAALGKRPKVLAVSLDYSLEDQHSDAPAFAEGLRALMRRVERDMGARGLQRPVFLATAEAGTHSLTDHPAIAGHAELARLHGDHRFGFSAPGYAFAQTRFGRPTEAARARMAEMDAHAIVALSRRQPWFCPLLLLAEARGKTIRVTARAMEGLVIDDAFGAGAAAGFQLTGTAKPCRVEAVAISADDPQMLILTCNRASDAPPGGPAPLLHYAHGAQGPSPDAHPANRGAVRDNWAAPARTDPAGVGGTLHRWALPAVLPVHPA